jgi:hypothetical protein
VATRFDKLVVRYEATVHVTAINVWLRCVERKKAVATDRLRDSRKTA